MPNLYFRKTKVKCLAHGHKSTLCVKSRNVVSEKKWFDSIAVGSSPTTAMRANISYITEMFDE